MISKAIGHSDSIAVAGFQTQGMTWRRWVGYVWAERCSSHLKCSAIKWSWPTCFDSVLSCSEHDLPGFEITTFVVSIRTRLIDRYDLPTTTRRRSLKVDAAPVWNEAVMHCRVEGVRCGSHRRLRSVVIKLHRSGAHRGGRQRCDNCRTVNSMVGGWAGQPPVHCNRDGHSKDEQSRCDSEHLIFRLYVQCTSSRLR